MLKESINMQTKIIATITTADKVYVNTNTNTTDKETVTILAKDFLRYLKQPQAVPVCSPAL